MRLIHVLLAMVLVPLMGLGAANAQVEETQTTGSQTAGSRAASEATEVQARQKRIRVTMKTTTPWVRHGGTVVLKGRVKGVRGRARVTILQRKIGKRGWHVETRKRTTRKGRFTHREGLTSLSRHYRACVKGRCSAKVLVRQGRKPTTPPPPPPPPPTKQDTAVSIDTLPSTNVEAGVAFTVGGGASGNLEGGSVYVQAYDASTSTWGSVGTSTVTGGRWSTSASISTAGRAIPLRAYFPGGVGLKDSASTAATMTVFGWYYFYDKGPMASVVGRWDGFNTTTMNTAVFPRSVVMQPDDWSSGIAYAEFNLNRSCTRLQTTLGLHDSTSDTSRKFNVVVKGDSVTKDTKIGIGYAAPVPVDIDLTGILRLRIEADQTAGAYDGTVWFGDARVLCAF